MSSTALPVVSVAVIRSETVCATSGGPVVYVAPSPTGTPSRNHVYWNDTVPVDCHVPGIAVRIPPDFGILEVRPVDPAPVT